MSPLIKRLILGGCLVLLAVQVVVQIRLASLDSQTTDEGVHLSAGYTYLTRGDFRFNPEHPPLVKILAALPLLFFHPNITPKMERLWNASDGFFYDSWKENRTFGEQLLYGAGNNPVQLIFWARLPMILLTFLLGLTIFLIAWRHWGATPALVATCLYVFNPTINGHGHLITTDIALSLGYLLTIYTFWQLWQKPKWKWAIYFGLSLGFALLVKHTAILLLPALIALTAVFVITKFQKFRAVMFKLAIALLIAYVAIWAGFGFHDRVTPQVSSVSTETIQENRANLSESNPQPSPSQDRFYNVSRPLLALFPGDYIKGLLMVIGHASGGHDSFLLGQISKTGWWYYFPLLFLIKTPLAALIIIGGGRYWVFRSHPPDRLIVSLLISAGVFFLFAILAKANLGLRHIVPVFPLLFLMAGWAVNANRNWRIATYALLVWLAVTFAWSFPTYLGYFNELTGGSQNGYQIATDSNLDWGQDMLRIASYISEHNIKKPYVSYPWLGDSALDYYLGSGQYRLLETYIPGEVGTVIIGASTRATLANLYPINCADATSITNAVFVCKLGL